FVRSPRFYLVLLTANHRWDLGTQAGWSRTRHVRTSMSTSVDRFPSISTTVIGIFSARPTASTASRIWSVMVRYPSGCTWISTFPNPCVTSILTLIVVLLCLSSLVHELLDQPLCSTAACRDVIHPSPSVA